MTQLILRNFVALGWFAGLLWGAGAARAEVVADAGPDQSIDIAAGCEARVTLDASGSRVEGAAEVTYTWTGGFPEGGGQLAGIEVEVTLDAGVHEVTLVVAAGGDSSTDTVKVEVKDVTPPVISEIAASPSMLWPPNHKLVPVSLDVRVSDNCDEAPECEIVSIASDEPVDARGDGNTQPDWRIAGRLSAELRAERDGRGDGRVYTLHVKCADDSGNESRSSARVIVPHDQGSAGEGRDPCKLKVSFDRVERNRLMARLDVSAGDDEIPADDTPSRLDDLEGYRLTLGLGTEELQGVFSAKGLAVTEHLRAQWNPRKGILLVVVRGVDLPEILGLDPTLEGKRIPAEVPIAAEVISPEEGSEPILLFSETFSCFYRHKLPKQHRGGR